MKSKLYQSIKDGLGDFGMGLGALLFIIVIAIVAKILYSYFNLEPMFNR